MPEVQARIPVPPERVFDVLSTPDAYGYWVLGSRKIRSVEGAFPAPGSRLHHQFGIPPLVINDHTTVLECDRPRRLVLLARAGPLGKARVELNLQPAQGGTQVRMSEEPVDLKARLGINPLTAWLVRGRNLRSLSRLRRLAVVDMPASGSTQAQAG